MLGTISGIVWIFFSYLLGSIPFGYIFSKLSGKNPLKIGWRKTSGSNVFKNVGKWQGVATGLCDMAKGWLVVYFAQLLGFPIIFQILAGIAAVAGHNWSIFLKFSGGRGIGTLIGALLALSVHFFWIFLIPLLVLAILWSASIGTILGLLAVIFFSIYFNAFLPAGAFIVFCLPVVFIKRLSPIKEISISSNKSHLIMSRFLFDDNKPLLKFRLRRFFKKRKKIISELKPEDFKKMMIAATEKIILYQEDIDRINVFPIADKDTGYNLVATLLGAKEAIVKKEYSNFEGLAKDIKDAVMVNARGNVGMIYAGYLIEFLDRIKNLETVDAYHISFAFKKATQASRESINEPKDGTILDVIKTVEDVSYEMVNSRKEKDIVKILEESYRKSQKILLQTKEKIEILKNNNVVDAGALGFVKTLEAWIESLKGDDISFVKTNESASLEVETKSINNQYEIVAMFDKIEKETLDILKLELDCFGDNLDFIETDEKIKIHIHTGDPDSVKSRMSDLSKVEIKIEKIDI